MKRQFQSQQSGVPSDHFQVELAARVRRLPPYMFGRINQLLYKKRRAGDDVIDLGMGNPSDPPEDLVIEKLSEAANDPRNHGYTDSQTDRLSRLKRGLQPHVPGIIGTGRYGHRARPVFSSTHVRRGTRVL